MTVLEQKFMESIPYILRDIDVQLKIANKLKALELKGRQDLNLTPEMVDDIMGKED